MTLENQLQQILDIKNDINEAISQQGVNISQTDAFSSYPDKIKSIQGSNTVQNGFSVTDIKITDHILNETEAIGWARTGQTIKKIDNPNFYNKCLQEYNESIIGRGYVSANVTLIGDLTEHKGVLSGFVSEKSGAKVLKTVPSTVTSFEMVAKIFVSEDHTTYKAIYCQPVSTNYITPQFEIGSAGRVQISVSKSGSSWDYYIQDTEQCLGQTLWVKGTLKDGVLSLLKSFDGKDYKLIGTVDNVQGCKWTTGIGVGVDGSDATHALDGGIIDLMECYIDINDDRWWTGCESFETKEHIDGHKYATIDKQAYIDNYYKKVGYVDYYIIDEEKEQITLPQLIEDECTYIYFCTGTQIKQDIIVDLSKEIELNNPFFLGQSKYFENEPNNLSWLKSTGEFHSKEMYPSMYEYISENVKAGIKDFANINSQYDDYCYVLDEQNETFRLPLLNGSEAVVSDNVQDFGNPASDTSHIAPANGWFNLHKTATANNQYIYLGTSTITKQSESVANGTNLRIGIEVKRGDSVYISYNAPTAGYFRFVYAKGNGSLYYYVGEAVNNAQLIDLGKITTQIATKVSRESDAFDGKWININYTVADSVQISTSSVVYDITEVLPKDEYDYEVLFYGNTLSDASNGAYTNLYISTDIITSSVGICGSRSRTNATIFNVGNGILPVGSGRYVRVTNNTSGQGTYCLYICGYRRLGRNENK